MDFAKPRSWLRAENNATWYQAVNLPHKKDGLYAILS